MRRLLALAVAAVVLAAGWLALRDSRLVAVERVSVVGASGAEAKAIQAALETAGRDMTTLHVKPEVLRAAVAPYPIVKGVHADAGFPHGLRVRVEQHVPVAVLAGGGKAVAVAGDGTLLPGTALTDLPTVKLRDAPSGTAVTDRRTRRTVWLLALAPAPLRARVTTAFRGADGLSVHLADGPAVRFGPSSRMTAKWAALQAVLTSPWSRGATAIDVRVPEHPAAAGLEQGAAQLGVPSTQAPG